MNKENLSQHAISVEAMCLELKGVLNSQIGKQVSAATSEDWHRVLELYIAEQVNTRKLSKDDRQAKRQAFYLSAEYLMGRMTSNNLLNLGLLETAVAAFDTLDLSLSDILESQEDMALGNGGLGRLAACFLDSTAALSYPVTGYGILYEHGLFKQSFHGAAQVEAPEVWREFDEGSQRLRPEFQQSIGLMGQVVTEEVEGLRVKVWKPAVTLRGIPWDVPIIGYGSETVNTLRLWEARAEQIVDWDKFQSGAFHEAQKEANFAQSVNKFLYPNDAHPEGKELRLIQQYFFSACSLGDIVRKFKATQAPWSSLPEFAVIQLNDTHPAIAIVELLRLLHDEERLSFTESLGLCRRTFAYTNHTLLPEALECWSTDLIGKLLPRHLELIYQLDDLIRNEEFSQHWPNDVVTHEKLAIVQKDGWTRINMGNLSVICSQKVNGVAEIHSKLVKTQLFPEFDAIYPSKFTNVTNGVTPRRWLKLCNPALTALLDRHIDKDWPLVLSKLSGIASLADDTEFQAQFMAVKQANKRQLVDVIREETGIEVSENALFDIQIKRLHEYKRQQLNLLHIVHLYQQLLENPEMHVPDRVFIFGAKAFPSYEMAKDIIFTINTVANVINEDGRIRGKLKVVFLPNYRVSLAEKIIPAADLSEQISLAGKEASGTGNMKLALNGAVTIGTLDGANVEIAEEVGDENIFIFGMTVDEADALRMKGYQPKQFIEQSPALAKALSWLNNGKFGNAPEIQRLYQDLTNKDYFMSLADFDSYCEAHAAAATAYLDKPRWARMAILNTAKAGKFTSDRSIEDYVERIWRLTKAHS
ncbi:glycogen/starch/alpha-glucan phosphorylase [Algicola sagamiensis]|uniref:glycogen/starch/alpha-glucan phosphorylase n=1 Tax=Algicola sagamiensis TaxID=163869 RepID=UPI0003748AEF|nr:glycogen/starch/alpha-glucan phosphorylase [Algicola sagamiensis]